MVHVLVEARWCICVVQCLTFDPSILPVTTPTCVHAQQVGPKRPPTHRWPVVLNTPVHVFSPGCCFLNIMLRKQSQFLG